LERKLRPLFILTLSSLLAAPLAAGAQTLRPGPGADLVQGSCGNCHGIDQVTSQQKDEAGWRTTVINMVNNGAALSDHDIDTVVSYLAANYGFGPPPAGDTAAAAGAAAPAAGAAAPAGAAASAGGATAGAATVAPYGAAAPAGAATAPGSTAAPAAPATPAQ
jgi:hypothetical protein